MSFKITKWSSTNHYAKTIFKILKKKNLALSSVKSTMFVKESKLIKYENKQERVIHDQGKKMVNNEDRTARDNGIRRQELLIS